MDTESKSDAVLRRMGCERRIAWEIARASDACELVRAARSDSGHSESTRSNVESAATSKRHLRTRIAFADSALRRR